MACRRGLAANRAKLHGYWSVERNRTDPQGRPIWLVILLEMPPCLLGYYERPAGTRFSIPTAIAADRNHRDVATLLCGIPTVLDAAELAFCS